MLRITPNHFVEGIPVVPTPNKGGSLDPTLLIVHDTAGALDYRGSVSWLCNPQAKASAHFVIGRKGEVVQLASCRVKTWHAGKSSYLGRQNVNDFSIGIEIANPGKLTVASGAKVARASFGAEYSIADYRIEFRESAAHGPGWWMPYTKPQLDAVLALAMAIRDKYEITRCAAHFEISPGRKIDVGPQFPLAWLKQKMEGREDADNIAMLEKGTPIRQWPSLFPTNVIKDVEGDGMIVDIVTSGEFFPAGQDLPPDWVSNAEKKILWYKVNTGEVSGWVLAANVKLL